MIVYYRIMRHKDENKNEAIFKATIQLLNEIGFSDISMSKIAKRAHVSPSTIYVYFENKEDMLSKLYSNGKQ
ncbi:helix-turn-helix domain containing protein [Paenibacillus mucilaginosus]|nr:helix-turn-helix domain containing protein [Paenibacillus caseinilyticus]